MTIERWTIDSINDGSVRLETVEMHQSEATPQLIAKITAQGITSNEEYVEKLWNDDTCDCSYEKVSVLAKMLNAKEEELNEGMVFWVIDKNGTKTMLSATRAARDYAKQIYEDLLYR